jgi:outer membrane protein TolC
MGRIGLALLSFLTVAHMAYAGSADPRPISRLDAIQLGVERNLGLLADRLEKERIAYGVEAAGRPFAPVLTFEVNYDDLTPPEGNSERDRSIVVSSGVDWKTQIGTELSARVNVDNHVSGQTTPDHTATLDLSVSQPLLKDAWGTSARTPLMLAELDDQIQQELFRSQLNDFIVELDQAYWNLAFAQADLKIKTRSRDRAQERYEDTRGYIQRGILADMEIYVVEENLVFFEQEMVRARESLALARRRLAELLQLQPEEVLVAAGNLDTPTTPVPTQADALATGMAANPMLRVLKLEWKRARVQRDYRENQAWPRLDLEAGLRLGGINNNASRVWSEVVKGDRPEGTLGLKFEMPLDRGPDRADVERANMQARAKQARYQEQQTRVRFGVLNLLTQLKAQTERLELSRRRRELAELKLEAEEEKYQSGISTLADVVRFQRELDEASISLRRDQMSLLTRQSKLQSLLGDLHQKVGCRLR